MLIRRHAMKYSNLSRDRFTQDLREEHLLISELKDKKCAILKKSHETMQLPKDKYNLSPHSPLMTCFPMISI